MDYGERRNFGNRHSGGGPRSGGYGGGSRGFGGGQRMSPVKEGEELDAVIEAVAEKGDGIAKKSGFVIFVPGTKVGDKVRIRVKKVAKKVAFAEVVGEHQGGGETTEQPAEETTEAAETTEEQEEQYDASQDSEEF